MTLYVAGLDLGQLHDYTALVIVQRVAAQGPLRLVHLHRFPLGTAYPAMADGVRALLGRPPLVGNVELVLDGTGVGVAVADDFRRLRAGLAVVPVAITGGLQATRDAASGWWRVPKALLVSVVTSLLQHQQLWIAPALEGVDVLAAELRNFRWRIDERTGRVSYGSQESVEWREGSHDDLVLATALACWRIRSARPFNAAVGGSRPAIAEMNQQPALSPHVEHRQQPQDRIVPNWNPLGLRPGERIRPPGQGSRYVSG
jgi:hypothetical protein